MTDEIGDLLCERAATHGDYADNAHIMQALKRLLREQGGWQKLSDVQRESLDMIALKAGRILTGNPNERDAWGRPPLALVGALGLDDPLPQIRFSTLISCHSSTKPILLVPLTLLSCKNCFVP